MGLVERISYPKTFDPPLILKILGKQHRAACLGRRSQNQGVPEGKPVEPVEINCGDNIRDIRGGHVKLREQLYFAAGAMWIDSKFACGNDKVFLQNLQRNHACSFPPMLSEKIERDPLFDWVRIIVDINEHVRVEEVTIAHEFRHD
jgi:hypothetical protein